MLHLGAVPFEKEGFIFVEFYLSFASVDRLPPRFVGHNPAMCQGLLAAVAIHDMGEDSAIFAIAVPHKVFAHSRSHLWSIATARTVDPRGTDTPTVAPDLPVTLKVCV